MISIAREGTGAEKAVSIMDVSGDPPDSLADYELAAARRDPRLTHGRDAVVADWWAAMGAAERTRKLADWGLQELIDSEAHERHRLQTKDRTNQDDPQHTAAIEAARERAELARAEKENQLVEHNEMTLISMVGALDALVEGLAPRARDMLIAHQAHVMMEHARKQEPEAAAKLDEPALDAIEQATRDLLAERVGSFDPYPRGVGAKRWEGVLSHVGLQGPAQRPVPPDLDQALTEGVALRHVLAHRAGRVDPRALTQAPTLRYADGDLVRITRSEYRRYSAALWTYGEEIIHRLMKDLAPAPTLENWPQNYTLNA
jgi:hypothetical protein